MTGCGSERTICLNLMRLGDDRASRLDHVVGHDIDVGSLASIVVLERPTLYQVVVLVASGKAELQCGVCKQVRCVGNGDSHRQKLFPQPRVKYGEEI